MFQRCRQEEEFKQRKAARPNDYEDSNAQPQREAPKEPAATKNKDTVKSIAQVKVDQSRASHTALEQLSGKRVFSSVFPPASP
jgi:hypothetical protein